MPSPGHFLLIEDAPNDALIFERTLREAAPGTTMFPCKNLATARNYLTGEKDFSDRARFPFPTAVLCDFRMGMDSGLDFLKWLRGHPLLSSTPLIIFSGGVSGEEINQAYQAGANAVIIKPSSPQELAQKIKAIATFWRIVEKPST